ncbi:transcriptional regulator, TetR family [Geosporobacter subterraneus DSM 17957]|uniref:Transcriptional regulator, TetR family n=1 Tax=Geosporobacter subterraneus DSM 17957 TaxID=1121919 RepID=A0A1M6NFW4_9FIRM|nr:TetR/AcrR family transcriptional regulator [Geosporobacter subterraneus]SHJ94496.1 transcriptional regulator, TetR family [Geosporobacter subterraneus DSM 17957]
MQKRIDKKLIQKRRMMSYFIEATHKIIEEEGIEFLTIRKVADLAGYNSATLYNYFENIDHLIFFASMKYLKDYAMDLPNYTKGAKNALDRYLLIWECFCRYSYNNPKMYFTIFFNRFSISLKDAIKEYYLIFPEELGEQTSDLLPMMMRTNIYDRNAAILEACAKEGFLGPEDVQEASEITLLVYQGMLSRIMNRLMTDSIEEAVEKTVKYVRQIVEAYGKK